MPSVSQHATRKMTHGLNNRDASHEIISKVDGAVDTTMTYADPAWITSLAGSKIQGDISGDAASITGTISESQVVGLTTDLGAKAPVNSPTFTGIPAGPTASVGTNTTQLATTAFVLANGGSGADASFSYFLAGGL